MTDLLDEAKGTVDEVHRAIFFQSFPHCPRGIDIVATWNARIRDVKGRLEVCTVVLDAPGRCYRNFTSLDVIALHGIIFGDLM